MYLADNERADKMTKTFAIRPAQTVPYCKRPSIRFALQRRWKVIMALAKISEITSSAVSVWS